MMYRCRFARVVLSVLLPVLLNTGFLFAQDLTDEPEPELVLPDVSSSLESTEITIDPDAIPDFSLVLPLKSVELPVIKEPVVSSAAFETVTTAIPETAEKDVFMEASLGVGVQSSFAGDFSVYRSTGSVPFALNFAHETVNGFGRHAASEGYNQSVTTIGGDTQIAVTPNLSIGGDARYKNGSYGLQGNSPSFYNMNYETASIHTVLDYHITPVISIAGAVDFLFNNQFASLSPSLSEAEREAAVKASRNTGFWFDPLAGVSFDINQAQLGLTAQYSGGTNQSRTQADFSFTGDWGKKVATEASVGVVVATNSASQTIYPFVLAVGTGSSVPFSLRAEGGLKTGTTDLTGLQSMYPFILTGMRRNEESFWSGVFDMEIPVRTYGSITGGVLFEKTAFGNGRLIPVLEDSSKSEQGLYTLQVKDCTVLNTTLGCTVPFKHAGFSICWNSAWIDNLSIQPANMIHTEFSATTENDRLGMQTDFGIALVKGIRPFWDVSAFWRFSNAVRVELAASDMLHFFTDRVLCKEYISRGGQVILSAHVYF